MNTTSMEFVIAQEKTGKNPSVLSEFMGISKNMEEALLVNPWNLGVGNSFHFLVAFASHVSLFCVHFTLPSYSFPSYSPPSYSPPLLTAGRCHCDQRRSLDVR